MLPQKGVTIYDSEADAVREIRFCPNEPSIYVDEQSSNALKQSVTFRNGRIFVPKEKPNLRKFLEQHPSNVANGGSVFKLRNKKIVAEQELEKEFLLTDAISVVRDREINDLLPIAIYFGININASISDIRYSLLRIAKTKTKEFLESLDLNLVKHKNIKGLIDLGLILIKNERIILTPKGRPILNSVLSELIS